MSQEIHGMEGFERGVDNEELVHVPGLGTEERTLQQRPPSLVFGYVPRELGHAVL